MRTLRPATLLKVSALAAVVTAALFWLGSGPPQVAAVEPGVNCSSYTDGVCEIEVGDIWFCDASYQDGVCPTSIAVGDTVRWEYPSSGQLIHTTTECGADCDAPTPTPLWDSGTLYPGDSFEFTFTEPGEYLYYCTFHPTTQRGLIRVLEPGPSGSVGDVNCNDGVNAIDATLVLQLVAGLLDQLSCQENADTNADGMTNAVDATLILQLVAGLLDSLPPGSPAPPPMIPSS
jgi:hypothetical protein